MKKRCIFSCLCFALVLLFSSCAGGQTDYLDVFRQDFAGEVEGELYGMDFSAGVARTGDEVIFTFYAPQSLSGVSVRRDAAGEVSVCGSELTLPDSAARFAPLLELFPTTGAVSAAEVTPEGRTRVAGEGFAVEFLSDGTPYLLERGACRARVVSFAAK